MAYFAHHKDDAHEQVFHAPVRDDLDEDEDNLDDLPPMTADEIRRMEKRERWRIAANIADFFGVIAGVLVILLLAAVIISLLNWVYADMTQSFTLLQAWV